MTNRNARPLLFSQIDVSKITLSEPRDNTYGKLVYLNYNNGPLRIIGPKMLAPLGVSRFITVQGQSPDENKLSISLSFNGMDDEFDPNGKALSDAHAKFCEIDEKITDLIYEKRLKLFSDGKNLSRETISNDRFTSKSINRYVDPKTDKVYPDSIRVMLNRVKEDPKKLDSIQGKPLLINDKNEPIDISADNIGDIVTKGCVIAPVLEATYMFVSKTTKIASLKWKLAHAVLFSNEETIDWNLLDNDVVPDTEPEDESEDVKEETMVVTDSENESENEPETNFEVDDRDDVADDEDVQITQALKKPPVVKKQKAPRQMAK